MTTLIVNAFASFIVTGIAKSQTRLNGTKWLVAVNLGVSLIASACEVWNGGSPDNLTAVLTVIVNTAISAVIAYVSHKLVKPGYKQTPSA